ncbi:MAG TPA: tripartite tricarboxylate transporter substrate binding protein [Burkholderiales bacterium]|nr:tripartite tricarboxylate transporter substrate binding protein [Burkholderiales bacterium]
MKPPRRRWALVLVLAAANAASGAVAPYPSKPVRLVVPFAAGGLNDTLARVLGQALGESLGVTTVIDNRAGATGTIGMNIVAKSSPDGYTLLFSSSSGIAVSPHLYRVPYDPVKDFSPISTVTALGSVLLVHPQSAARSVADLVAAAKASPGQLKFGSVGPGTSQHLAGEVLKMLTGVDLLHVPYKAGGQVLTDLIARQIDIDFEPMPTALPYIRSGRLRPLAVTTAARSPLLPEVPTIAESGLAGYDLTLWTGVLGPAGMPQTVVTRLHAELVKVVHGGDMARRLAGLGAEPTTSAPQEFAAYIKSELARWGKVVRALGLKPE